MNEEQVIALMESSKSPSEWNLNCDEVKRKCGGYPAFWFPLIIASGLAKRVLESIGSSADIKIK